MTVKEPTHTFQAGDGLLFATARLHQYEIDTAAGFRTAVPAPITSVKEGWRFVAVPFPMDFAIAKITSNKGIAEPFFRFEVGPPPTDTGKKHEYSWPEHDNSRPLKPFKAYAYYFREGRP